MGALVQLQFALNSLGLHQLLAGELSAAERLLAEDRLIAEATGNPPVAFAALMLAACGRRLRLRQWPGQALPGVPGWNAPRHDTPGAGPGTGSRGAGSVTSPRMFRSPSGEPIWVLRTYK
jgi:hypothetical protein